MNETLYSWTFNFHKVVRQQNSRAVADFILSYTAVYLRIWKWKNYWNRSTLAKVIVKIKVARFLWPTVYMHCSWRTFFSLVGSYPSQNSCVALGWVCWILGGVGLGQEIWTHVHLCCQCSLRQGGCAIVIVLSMRQCLPSVTSGVHNSKHVWMLCWTHPVQEAQLPQRNSASAAHMEGG